MDCKKYFILILKGCKGGGGLKKGPLVDHHEIPEK